MGGMSISEEATVRTLVEDAFTAIINEQTSPNKQYQGSVVAAFESLLQGQVTAGNISDPQALRIKNALKQMETSVDGEFVMNRVNLANNVRGWADTVNNVEDAMRRNGVDSIHPETYQQYLDAQAMLSTVAEQTGTVFNPRRITRREAVYELRGDLDRIGFSGRVMYYDPSSGEKKFIKGRMRVRDLPGGIAIAAPDIMIKKETKMEEFINFDIVSGSSAKPRATAPDIQTLLFHRDEFFDTAGGDVTLPQTTLTYGQDLVAELQSIQTSGIMPGKVKERMLQDLRESGLSKFMRTFEPHKASSKEKNREMVRRLNDAILTGNLTDPEVIGALSNYYRNELYDQKVTRYITDTGRAGMGSLRVPKTPDYMPFDISSEMSALQGKNVPRLLSGRTRPGAVDPNLIGFSNIELPDDPSLRYNSIELPMIRVHEGMLLMSGRASAEGHYSLGGFDFDDKGLPALRSIRQRDGHMRVVAFTTRQPTGPKEYIVQDLLKDQGSLQSLFLKNKTFMTNLEEMSKDPNLDPDLSRSVKDVLFYMNTDASGLTDDAQRKRFANLQRRFAGLALTNQEVANGQLMGTQSSRILERDNPYFVAGQREVDTVIQAVYERAHGGVGVKQISDGVMRAMRTSGRSGVIALTPETMRQMAPQDRMDFLPAYFEGQFFKLIMQARPSEISQTHRDDIITQLNAAGGVTAPLMSALTNAVDDQAFRIALQDILENAMGDSNAEQRIRAAISGGLQGYVSSVQLPEQGEIIGSYINRLMTVASTEGQRTAIASRLQELESAGNAQAGALRGLLENIYSGFIPPSDAVDAAVNAGGQVLQGIEPGPTRAAYIQGLVAALSEFNPSLATDPLMEADFTNKVSAFLSMLHQMPAHDEHGRIIRSIKSRSRRNDDKSWKVYSNKQVWC